jgi:hypothetical protein
MTDQLTGKYTVRILRDWNFISDRQETWLFIQMNDQRYIVNSKRGRSRLSDEAAQFIGHSPIVTKPAGELNQNNPIPITYASCWVAGPLTDRDVQHVNERLTLMANDGA